MSLHTALSPVAHAVRRALALTLAVAASPALAQQTPPWLCTELAIAVGACTVVESSLDITEMRLSARNDVHPPGPRFELRGNGHLVNRGRAWILGHGWPIGVNTAFPGSELYGLQNMTGAELRIESAPAGEMLHLPRILNRGLLRIDTPAAAGPAQAGPPPPRGWVTFAGLLSHGLVQADAGARLILGETTLLGDGDLAIDGELVMQGRLFAEGKALDLRNAKLSLRDSLWRSASLRAGALTVESAGEIVGDLRVDGATVLDIGSGTFGSRTLSLGREATQALSFQDLALRAGLLNLAAGAELRVAGDLQVGLGRFEAYPDRPVRMDALSPEGRANFAQLRFEPGADLNAALDLYRNTEVHGELTRAVRNLAHMRFSAAQAGHEAGGLMPERFDNSQGRLEVARGWLRVHGGGLLGGEVVLGSDGGLRLLGDGGSLQIEQLSSWTAAAMPGQISRLSAGRLEITNIDLLLPGVSQQVLNQGALHFIGSGRLIGTSGEVNRVVNQGLLQQTQSTLLLERLDNREFATARFANGAPNRVAELVNQGHVAVDSGRLVVYRLLTETAPASGRPHGYADGRLFGGQWEVADGVLQVIQGLGPVEVLAGRVDFTSASSQLEYGPDDGFVLNPPAGLPALAPLRHIEPGGVLRLMRGAGFGVMPDRQLINQGWLEIGEGSSLVSAQPLLQRAGLLVIDGTLFGRVQVEGGAVRGNGTILGGLTLTGTLAPGASIGALTVGDAFEMQETAVLQIELDAAGVPTLDAALPWIFGPLQHADLLILQDAQLGGVLELDASGSGAFLQAMSLPFLVVSGGLQGDFLDLRLVGAAGRLEAASLRFELDPLSGATVGWIDITPVPEPAPVVLLALGLAALALRRRSLQQRGQ